MPTVIFKGSKADLIRSLKLIPAVLAGTHPDSLGLAPVFWGTIGNVVLGLLYKDFKTKFAGGEGLDGEKWAKLAVATLARKKVAPGHLVSDILVETTALMESLAPGTDDLPAGATGQVFDFLPDGVRIGTEVKYADFHQHGTKWMPPRRIVPLDPDTIPPGWEAVIEEAMEVAMAKVIEEMVGKGGLL